MQKVSSVLTAVLPLLTVLGSLGLIIAQPATYLPLLAPGLRTMAGCLFQGVWRPGPAGCGSKAVSSPALLRRGAAEGVVVL
ncbi:MAG TPA: hypothetical protein VMW83_11160 [Spirochaetia bacterium]|nr:hypothetical protein [Spirochaetia bacterium]